MNWWEYWIMFIVTVLYLDKWIITLNNTWVAKIRLDNKEVIE